MKVRAWTGSDEIAAVYVAETDDGRHVEFVESVEPPIPRDEKWVLIVSTLFGCPGRCRFCDAGGAYAGPLSRDEILFQTDYLIERRYPPRVVPAGKFKIQFARMGDPALNDAVLDVLEELPDRYDAPGLMPALSTIAPSGRDEFFERLLDIARSRYKGRFQLQFSLHTTDPGKRDWLMPMKKWGLEEIARYGERFHVKGGRKITLNFALAEGMPLDLAVMKRHFDPQTFYIKITPVNPTYAAVQNNLQSSVSAGAKAEWLVGLLRSGGYDALLSIGALEENAIGSNCGQYIKRFLEADSSLESGYDRRLVSV
jgi:23S rRNA (adenine2503-C2)-methyltransferase